MSVDVVIPTAANPSAGQQDPVNITLAETEQQLQEGTMEKIRGSTNDQVLSVWTGHTIDTAMDEDYDSLYSSRKPSAVSSVDDHLQEEIIKQQKEAYTCHGNQGAIVSAGERDTSYCDVFRAATVLLNGITEDNKRKTSDPLLARRSNENRNNVLDKQRCHSDCTGVSPLVIVTATNRSTLTDDNSSAVGGDSGIVECTSSCHGNEVLNETRNRYSHSSLASTSDNVLLSPSRTQSSHTQSISSHTHSRSSLDHARSSKSNPHSNGMTRTASLDEGALTYFSKSKETSNTKGRRGKLTKHLSLSSMGGSSDCTISSLFDQSSSYSMASELLSSLGFGDFDSPQLIPDRFIPHNAESAKPSKMYEQTLLGIYSSGGAPRGGALEEVACSVTSNEPQKEFIEQQSALVGGDSLREVDLPLGATADNFISTKRVTTPPVSPSPPSSPTELNHTLLYSQASPDLLLHSYNRKLETVPEETASDLSPSPRWLSPRVSLDHSTYDVSMGQLLGSSLNVNRKRSLPNRDGYRMSVDSILSEQESTVYFSITSYDDDIAREEREREEAARLLLPVDESSQGRRRRKGVHGAPPELLSWLKDQSHCVNDDYDDDIPWPFNEQAHIRRSLTEYQFKQRLSQGSSMTLEDRSLSPVECEDPLQGVFQRRFSINGPLLAPKLDSLEDSRRLSLPSKYGHYRSSMLSQHPPSKGTALEQTIDEETGNMSGPEFGDDDSEHQVKSSTDLSTETNTDSDQNQHTNTDTDQYQYSTRLPPGMTRADVRELKREANVLKKELDITKQKLRDAERVRVLEGEDHLKHIADNEEWLRSELWNKERKCRELEETLEALQRNYKILKQNQLISIARGKEEIKDIKDREISELKHKLEEKTQEFRGKASKLEDECRHLRSKENQLLKKANQQNYKIENEELQREITRLKEQLRQEKQITASASKEKAMELKQLRTKAQLEKEEALKNQKEFLTKIHQNELSSVRQAVHQFTDKETKSSGRSVLLRTSSYSPAGKQETNKRQQYQIERLERELQWKDDEIAELKGQLKVLHKEHFVLQKELSSKSK
ncbi:PREDICTED: uncharacterized protein LOC105316736 isoform X2 [Amphimedon queenslandica]|uniref:Uncharacterized protein n=1 Tax=Amphimedon queenslandica TaxID=400682 RepID=A0A1X7VIB4_AMPQE|nr:PREDICTED: uncharacterized protein LOC105316736 isoform X2 [Amphimedon queenslandica]|eukprot:XP_019848753.1 PREDICTED: uncharacterized protein LOC105316736 isoform X2 [Amphimedon queenslandica]